MKITTSESMRREAIAYMNDRLTLDEIAAKMHITKERVHDAIVEYWYIDKMALRDLGKRIKR